MRPLAGQRVPILPCTVASLSRAGGPRSYSVQGRCHQALRPEVAKTRRPGKQHTRTRCSAEGSADPPEARTQLVDKQRDATAGRYTALSRAAAILAVGLLALPPRFIAFRLGQPTPVAEAGIGRLVGASLWGQAAALKALESAALHDRLKSATYKRLNLALAGWGVTQVLVAILHASALTNIFWLQTIFAACCAYVSGQNAQKTEAEIPDIGLLVPQLTKNKTEFGWIFAFLSASTLAIGIGLLAAPFATFQPSAWTPAKSPVGSFLLRNYGCSIAFSSTLFFTLKDSEDRGRSTSSTFQLLAKAIFLVALCGAGTFWIGGLRIAAARDIVLGGIAAIFLVQRQKPQKPQSA